MAQLVTDEATGRPKCSGCGTMMPVLHWIFDSRVRDPYTKKAAERGSSGPAVVAFAREHQACPEPLIYQGPTGILIVDRRVRKGADDD